MADEGRGSGSQAGTSGIEPKLEVPRKLAVVMGRESDGVTAEMLGAASQRIHLPLVGFNTSLNLQVGQSTFDADRITSSSYVCMDH